jgi:hypothetical protein
MKQLMKVLACIAAALILAYAAFYGMVVSRDFRAGLLGADPQAHGTTQRSPVAMVGSGDRVSCQAA